MFLPRNIHNTPRPVCERLNGGTLGPNEKFTMGRRDLKPDLARDPPPPLFLRLSVVVIVVVRVLSLMVGIVVSLLVGASIGESSESSAS
jgi:hypothetical protein